VYNNPLKAYQEIDKSCMSGREVEAYALTKAAMALRACQNNWAASDIQQQLESALKLNQRVWNIFQLELTKADNPMPINIKQNILKLGAFIDNRSLQLIAHPKPQALDIIISINENLAAGLRQSVGVETAAETSHVSSDKMPPHTQLSETP